MMGHPEGLSLHETMMQVRKTVSAAMLAGDRASFVAAQRCVRDALTSFAEVGKMVGVSDGGLAFTDPRLGRLQRMDVALTSVLKYHP
jgi:hypothetical protein